MIAATSSIGRMIFNNISFPVLSIVSVFFAFFILNLGYDAIIKLNKILVPIIILFVFVISIIFVFRTDFFVPFINSFSIKNLIKYLILALFYIAFNMVFSSGLIIQNGKDFTKKQAKYNSLIIAIGLMLIVFIMNYTLLHSSIDIYYSDMPILAMAYSISGLLGYSFSFVLWLSVLTTLISTLYIFINCFNKNQFLVSAITLTLAFILSFFGFNYIVNMFYPIQGVIGIVFIVFALIFYFKNRKLIN